MTSNTSSFPPAVHEGIARWREQAKRDAKRDAAARAQREQEAEARRHREREENEARRRKTVEWFKTSQRQDRAT